MGSLIISKDESVSVSRKTFREFYPRRQVHRISVRYWRKIFILE